MYKLSSLIADLQKTPSRILFKNGNNEISSEQFLSDVNKLIVRLSQSTRKRCALCYQNGYLFTTALFAVLCSGGCPILLPNNQLGTQKNFKNEYDVVLSDDALDEKESGFAEGRSNSSQTVTLFTSGSTGKPKKIIRSITQLMNEITVLENVFQEKLKTSQIYSTVSHQHIYGLLFYILWPLCAGRVICFPTLKYPEEIETIINSNESAVLISSSALLSRLSDVRLSMPIFSSGGLLKREDALKINPAPIEVLGSTETSGVAYRQQRDSIVDAKWNPLPKVDVKIDQQTGCLDVRSPFFEGDHFVMGDRAEIYEDGLFKLLGRADRIVKIEGKRVSLSEIEETIKQHDYVKDAYAISMELKRQYIAVAIVLTENGKQILNESGKIFLNTAFKKWLSNYFDAVLLPKQFRYIDSIPVNEQGKRVLTEIKKIFFNRHPAT